MKWQFRWFHQHHHLVIEERVHQGRVEVWVNSLLLQAWIQSFAIGSTIYGLRGFEEKDEFEKMDFDAMHRVKHT